MIRRTDLKIRVIVILILLGFSCFYVFPLKQKINLGLDLRGGMSVLLRADVSAVEKGRVRAAIEGAIEKVRNRVDSFGVKETSIQIQGDNSILVQVPGVVDRTVVNKLREVGKLEFKIVERDQEKIDEALAGNVPEGYELTEYKGAQILLNAAPAVLGSDLDESYPQYQGFRPVVTLQFTSPGAKTFAKVTEENIGRELAILLDGRVISAPTIRTAIVNGRGIIEGDFSYEETRMLSAVLNSGALPVPLVVEEERSVGPLLGSDSIRRGVNSIALGAVLVVFFMVIYYFLGGLVALICLVLDLLFILGGLNLLHGTLTLPGIAGMILTLGMAVDANVLIFERIREELNAGKPLSIAAKNGFDRAKRTIFDANVTTLIAALFLFIFGTGPIRGFATTLSIGIVASIFTAVFVGRTVFALLLNMNVKNFPMLRFFPSANINFVKLRNICLIISLVVIAIGMSRFVSQGQQMYGIDFRGGQVLEYQLKPAPEIEEVRKLLHEAGYSDLVIQEFRDLEGGVIIKSKDDLASQIDVILAKSFPTVERLRVTTVGPAVGKVLKQKAYLAVLLSLVGILFYIVIRFKHFDFAFAGIIALFHDVLISLGFIALSGYEVTLLTITALLTIAGYSINDTIVVYDRIREISPRNHKLSLREIINRAINCTLSRTIITSLTTIMVVTAIFCLGGEALKGFSFTLLVGFIAGTYSSIYIASPLVLLFRKSRV